MSSQQLVSYTKLIRSIESQIHVN